MLYNVTLFTKEGDSIKLPNVKEGDVQKFLMNCDTYSNIEIIGSVFEKEDTEPDYEKIFNQLNVDKPQKVKVKVRKVKPKRRYVPKAYVLPKLPLSVIDDQQFFLDRY